MSNKKLKNDGPKGTNGFIAPEILKGYDYNNKIDLWSLGVTTFLAIGGYYPFHSKSNYVVDPRIEFHKNFWKNISENAIDFIKNMLSYDPKERFSTSDAISHSWIVS